MSNTPLIPASCLFPKEALLTSTLSRETAKLPGLPDLYRRVIPALVCGHVRALPGDSAPGTGPGTGLWSPSEQHSRHSPMLPNGKSLQTIAFLYQIKLLS